MLKIENDAVTGLEPAIRGMRNPKNSWEKSDSFVCEQGLTPKCSCCENRYTGECDNGYIVGPNDFNLMTRLRNAGTDHRKFMRMITVYLDITAPLYWWKEFDTYKVGTVANSCSTMHKITDKEFTLEDFSCEHLLGKDANYEDTFDLINDHGVDSECCPTEFMKMICGVLNFYRTKYLETKTKPMKEEAKRAPLMKKYWWQMIQLLPTSYNQKRTVMLNYEVLANIYKSRRNHKLDEWHTLCDWIESLPYSELITGGENK